VVEEAEAETKPRPHGTKAKPRRTLSGGPKKKAAPKAPAEVVAPVEELVNPNADTQVSEPEIAHEQPTAEVSPAPEESVAAQSEAVAELNETAAESVEPTEGEGEKS
jgi:hypothetical protein